MVCWLACTAPCCQSCGIEFAPFNNNVIDDNSKTNIKAKTSQHLRCDSSSTAGMFGVQAEQPHLCRQSADSSFLHETVKICDWADEDDCKITSFQYSRTQKSFLCGWNVKVWIHYKICKLPEGLVSTVKFEQHYEKTKQHCSQIHAFFCTKQSNTALFGVTVWNWHHHEYSDVILACIVFL